LLLSPEHVAWTDDGQRCQPRLSERQAFFDQTLAWLEHHAQSVEVLQGDWADRRLQALNAVTRLLEA
jgi:nicotinamide riboside kinase